MPVSIAGPKTGVRRRRMTVRYLSLPVISTLGFDAGARVWAIGALLLLPLYFFYVVHFTIAGAPGTGFLQYDQAYYMAIARAYFADGGFSPVYGLPFSPDPATPRLYFQPLTLALGIAWELTGGDPGILYMLAGLLLALCCARVMIALYGELVTGPRLAVALGLICFFWGGGCLALAGYCRALINGEPPIGHLFDFDPFAGFWFLNLGRNLIFTTEAFYHLLFLGAVLLVLRRRFAAALLCVAVLSASHAFSGLQLIAVLGTWSMLDRLVGRADRPPVLFVAALIALAALHIGYYLVFLDHMSEEHRSLHQQWALAWVLPWSSALAAYGPVAALAATALVSRWRRGQAPTRSQRLLLVWFAVSFALANHDLLFAPVQPLHFTRGHIWTPLFLLGAPVLIRAIAAASRTVVLRAVVPAAIVGLLLLDNTAWFLWTAVSEHYSGRPSGLTLDVQERAVIERLGDGRYGGYLLVSQSQKLGYLATVYSPLRSWYSHAFNTPYAAQRKAELDTFFATGEEPRAWSGRPLLAVVPRQETATAQRLEAVGFGAILVNDGFVLLARGTSRP
jgi:hypothetical protein